MIRPAPCVAYPTKIAPTEFATNDDVAAVYWLHPGVVLEEGFTAYVIAATSIVAADTVLYPCTKHGDRIGFDSVAIVETLDHAVALEKLGYQLRTAVLR